MTDALIGRRALLGGLTLGARRAAAGGLRPAQRLARRPLVPRRRRATPLPQPAPRRREQCAGARICPFGHVAGVPRQRQRAPQFARLSRPCRAQFRRLATGRRRAGRATARAVAVRPRRLSPARADHAPRLRRGVERDRQVAGAATGRRSCAPRACRAAPTSSSSTAPTTSGGVPYYESIDLNDAFHPQTILALLMNDHRLPIPHGAPVRLTGRAPAWLQARQVRDAGRGARPDRQPPSRQGRLLGRSRRLCLVCGDLR